MTMQTTSLPFQITGTNAQSGANALGAKSSSLDKSGANANGGFGATLSREISQRQQPQQQQQAMPAASASQPKPAQQQQSKPNAADKPAHREPAQQASAKPAQAAKEGTGETKSAQASEGAEEASETEAAAAGAPAADMLAFMASLTQPAGTAGGDAAAAAADAALGGSQQGLTALENALQNMKGMATGATDDSGAKQDLAAGVQLPTVDTGAVGQDAAALLQERGQHDAAGFQAKLHDAQQAVPAAAEEAPPLAQLQAQAAKLAEVQTPAAGADRIPARVGTQAWDNQVSQRIVYMVGKEQAATLTLNPPDLGPVQIVLNVSNDQASVAFSSQQLEVRQALENALPRLREMMSESGIALGNATVDAGSANQQGAQDSERRAHGGGGNGGANGLAGTGGEAAVNEVAPRAARTVAIGDRGMVDLFA